MGWRYKKTGTAEARKIWRAALRLQGKAADAKTAFLANDRFRMDPVFPSQSEVRISCRQVGYFRGKKIFETGMSLSFLQ